MPEKLLTTEEAAELLHVHPRTLASFRLRGGGPSYLFLPRPRRRLVRYREVDLLAWMSRASS